MCARFIHSSLIFAFSTGKNERDVEQKKEACAQKRKICAQKDAIIREVKSTVELRQMSVWKTECFERGFIPDTAIPTLRGGKRRAETL